MKKLSLLLIPLLLLSSCVFDVKPIELTTLNNPNLSAETLQESLTLGTQFLLENQKSEGNFEYEYDFLTKTYTEDDNQVRQAGALWGLALIHKNNPTDETRQAIIKGLEFFKANSHTVDGVPGQLIAYPSEDNGRTGTVALVSLALTDFLTSEDNNIEDRESYRSLLQDYMDFLVSLRQEDGLFFASYDFETGEGYGSNSSYFDGESLLAMTKAYKLYGAYDYLGELITESAEEMYEENVDNALDEDEDNDITKGFFQWGIMSFYEIYTTETLSKTKYAKWSVEMANWMIDTHKVLERTRNTAYAYEGIIHAMELARLIGKEDDMDKFARAVDKGLSTLTSWQVGNSTANSFLRSNPTQDKQAIGGIMNAKDESILRIDVTQHQMNAVISAIRFLYHTPFTPIDEQL